VPCRGDGSRPDRRAPDCRGKSAPTGAHTVDERCTGRGDCQVPTVGQSRALPHRRSAAHRHLDRCRSLLPKMLTLRSGPQRAPTAGPVWPHQAVSDTYLGRVLPGQRWLRIVPKLIARVRFPSPAPQAPPQVRGSFLTWGEVVSRGSRAEQVSTGQARGGRRPLPDEARGRLGR
jgi:hypothetical protein